MIMPTGYFLSAQGQFCWTPIPRVYSPPRMHPGVIKTILWLPEDAPKNKMGLFVGAGGIHFKNMTALSGVAYLFLLRHEETGRYFVEIWGYPGTEQAALRLLSFHWHKNIMWNGSKEEHHDHSP